jgi:hypothetical protein
MATKRTKGTIQKIVETITDLVSQPFSDESNEVPSAAALRKSMAVAAGPRRSKAKTKAKAKPRAKAKTKTRSRG